MDNAMKEYGILCDAKHEKEIVNNINLFLESKYKYHKMSKAKNNSLLDARLPFRYFHYYYQFIKQDPRWYFELYPNADLEGRIKFSARQDAGWILFLNNNNFSMNTDEMNREVDQFFDDLLSSVGFETKLLHRYEENEERL